MNKTFIFLLIAAFTPALPALADRDHSGGGGQDRGGDASRFSGSSDRSFSSGSNDGSFSSVRQRSGFSRSSRPGNRGQYLPHTLRHSVSGVPSRNFNGRSASVVPRRAMGSASIRTHMSGIVHEAAFSGRFNNYIATESLRGHYYWHNWNGQNFCHYYDRWGCHWFGWYVGAGFFWTQYYAGNWWWWDPDYNYWCYWHNGYWWWDNPSTQVVYVYNNGTYTPADNTGGVDAGGNGGDNPAPPSPSSPHPDNSQVDSAPKPSAPVDQNQGIVSFKSPDETQVVQIQGDSSDAFLVDKTSGKNSQPVYLASNVSNVKYLKKAGKRQIELIMTDGGSKFFNTDGSAVDSAQPPADPDGSDQ